MARFEDARSCQVFDSVVAYIRCHKPRLVVLENVTGLLTVNHGKDFQKTVLGQLNDAGSYNVDWEVLNTREHGVPQNRPRVYIVCIRKDVDQGNFTWPKPLDATRMPGLDRFLDSRKEPGKLKPEDFKPEGGHALRTFEEKMSKLRREEKQPFREPYVFDVARTPRYSSVMHNRCPCLLRTSSTLGITL